MMKMIERRAEIVEKKRRESVDELTGDILTTTAHFMGPKAGPKVLASPTIRELLGKNLGFLDDCHDGLKLACLLAGKILSK